MLSKEIQLEVNKGHASIDGVYTIQGVSYRNSVFCKNWRLRCGLSLDVMLKAALHRLQVLI
jgi:hypothetical protein